MQLKRILVPVDFSRHSLDALEYAVALGKSFNPEIVLLFALEPAQFAGIGHAYGGALPVNVEMLMAEQRRLAKADLAKLEKSLVKRNVRVRALVAEGTPYRAIVDTADRLGADLVVMGTHGRSGLPRFFMGSVAEMVVRHAQCPVLTVRGRRGRKTGARSGSRGAARRR
jgi:nucleotide-binding universal stress UspA family protein